MSRTIRVSAGETQYLSVVLTEKDGKNIVGDTFAVSLSPSYDAPGEWTAPELQTISTSSVRLKLLVGSGGITPEPGAYWIWLRAIDTPETALIRVGDRITIA